MPKQTQGAQLPGRRNVKTRIATMVEHYAESINARTDLTDAEKKAAIAKYKAAVTGGEAAPE